MRRPTWQPRWASVENGAGAPDRRVVVTVCLRESGTVRLPVERGAARVRLDAAAILRTLTALVARRGLGA